MESLYRALITDYGYGSDDSGSNKKPIIIGTAGSSRLNYSPDIVHQTQALMQHQHPAPQPGRSATIPNSASVHSASGQVVATNTTSGPMVCYEYSYPDSNSNHTTKSTSTGGGGCPANLNLSNCASASGVNGFNRPESEHHYEQPMVVFNGSQMVNGGHPAQSPAGTDSGAATRPSRSESCGTSSSNASTGDRHNRAHGKSSLGRPDF